MEHHSYDGAMRSLQAISGSFADIEGHWNGPTSVLDNPAVIDGQLYGAYVFMHPECHQGEYAPIVKIIQLCWAVICMCQVLFMFSRAPRVPWEAMYLPGVECVIYTLAFTGNGYVRMVDGRILTWSRLASWLVCCPVMLGQISAITLIKYQSIPLNPMMIACSIIRTVFGVSAGVVQEEPLKWVFFWLGIFFFAFELLGCYLIFAIAIADFEACKTELANKVIGRIKTMRAIIFICWPAITVTWVLSSAGTCLVDDNYTTIGFVVLDAVCKNMYGVVIWSTTWGLLNGKWDRDYARTFGQEEEQQEEAPDFDAKGGAMPGANDNVEVKMFGKVLGSVRRANRGQGRSFGGRAGSRPEYDDAGGHSRNGARDEDREDDGDHKKDRRDRRLEELERTIMEMRGAKEGY